MHGASICEAYVQACKHLAEIRRHQGVEIHALLAGVASGTLPLSLRAMPNLLIFKPWNVPQVSEDAWTRHARAITESGIKIRYA